MSGRSMSTSDEDIPVKVGIVGAGLTGTMLAAFLDRIPGIQIILFERSMDLATDLSSNAFGNAPSAIKRSINMALSHRGIKALDELALTPEVLKVSVRMPKRVLHDGSGGITTQYYGVGNETLWSVSRHVLNSVLMRCVSPNKSSVEIRTGHLLLYAEENGKCRFSGPEGEYDEQFDFVIGADGAFSRVRDAMLRMGRVSFSRTFIPYGYKELTIPAVKDINGESHFALPDPEGMHIWPKGDMMLVAMPNADKSFTATLFAPYKTCFDVLDTKNAKQVKDFFTTMFPDALPYMPTIVEDFQSNPVGSLVQIRADPWKIKRFLIIGDAAHAVVPFYGQGMNSAFEDALQFYLLLRDRFRSAFTLQQRIKAFDDTSKIFYLGRKPAIDVLSDISENQFRDMSHNTNSWWYLLHHRLRQWLMPASLKTMYRFVAFSNEPYHKAVKLAKRNDLIFKGVLFTTLSAIGLFGYQAFIHLFNKKK